MIVPVAVTAAGASLAGAAYYFRGHIKDWWNKLSGDGPGATSKAAAPIPLPSVPGPSTPNTPKAIPEAVKPVPPPVPIPPKIDAGPGSQKEYTLEVTGTNVNVRSGPSTKHPVLTTVSKPKRLKMPHSNSWSAPTDGAPQGWSGVILDDGRTGWIASQFVVIPADVAGEFGFEFGADTATNNPASRLAGYIVLSGRADTADLRKLVRDFQKWHNRNRGQLNLAFELVPNGKYDPMTSAALTQYTHKPIPPISPHSRNATLGEILTTKKLGGDSQIGIASAAKFNLLQSLKMGYDPSNAVQRELICIFQAAVNNDPIFPGPAFAISPRPVNLHPPLAVTGKLDDATKAALAS